MENIDDIVRKTKLSDIKNMKISIEDFINLYNQNKAILIDVREEIETKVWTTSFALNIPYNKLPDNLDKLPKDKLIVCACPNEYRSSMAKEYLRFKGFNVKNLDKGLSHLINYLKGGKAKEINL